jgi:hypothetical protein
MDKTLLAARGDSVAAGADFPPRALDGAELPKSVKYSPVHYQIEWPISTEKLGI